MESIFDIIKLLGVIILSLLGFNLYGDFKKNQRSEQRENEAIEKIKQRYSPDNMSDSYRDANNKLS